MGQLGNRQEGAQRASTDGRPILPSPGHEHAVCGHGAGRYADSSRPRMGEAQAGG